MPDDPNRPEPRFPAENERAVMTAIRHALDRWRVSPGDLCLCGGARGGDLIFAEVCLELSADVRLLLALPPDEFIDRSIRQQGTDWEERFNSVLTHGATSEFAAPPNQSERHFSPFSRFNDWLLAEALSAAKPDCPLVLLLWDGKPNSGGQAGTGDFAEKAKLVTDNVHVIDPLAP